MFYSRTSALLTATAILSATGSTYAADVNWTNAVSTNQVWSVGTNWSTNPAIPANGDSVFFGLPGSASIPATVATAATGANGLIIDTDPVLTTLNLQDNGTTGAMNWIFSAATATSRTLTLNSGIESRALSNHTISGSATTLKVALGGANIWNIDRNLNTAPAGTQFSGLTVSAPISGAFSLTKTGFRTLSMSNNNTFNGLIIKRNTVFTTGLVAVNNPLGDGSVTFANDVAAPNNEAVVLSINSGISRTFDNNFINSNANASQMASIVTGGGNGNLIQRFTGTFSTSGLNAAQFLTITGSGNSTGTSNNTLIFSGSWAGYTVGASDAIRIGAGAVQLDGILTVAPVNYALSAADATMSGKLILNLAGNQTINQNISFIGAVNSMRNSFGTSNATAGTATTLAGTGGTSLTLTDNDGANLFSLNSGVTLALTGNIAGTSTGKVRINDGYIVGTGTAATTASTLQLPAGTVSVSATGNTFVGGVDVIRGTLLVNNASGSGTGPGPVTVGFVGANVPGPVTSTGATGSRVLAAIDNLVAQTLVIGQPVSGTGVPSGAVITGITTTATTATISISASLTAASPADLAFAPLTTTATLGGNGRIAPNGTTGLLVKAGSTLGLVDGLVDNLEVDLTTTTGGATFETGSTFAFELGDSTNSDSIAFTGLDDSLLTLNGNVINLAATGSITAGSHTYTLMTFSPDLAVAPTLVLGTLPTGFSAPSLNQQIGKIELTVTYTSPLSPYDTFINSFPSITGADKLSTADPDGDGLTNQQEFAFGLAPDSGASVNPIVSPLNKTTGLFIYTRRGPAVSGLAFTHEYSTTLTNWLPFTPDSVVSNGASPAEQVTVKVPNSLLTNGTLFVRPVAK